MRRTAATSLTGRRLTDDVWSGFLARPPSYLVRIWCYVMFLRFILFCSETITNTALCKYWRLTNLFNSYTHHSSGWVPQKVSLWNLRGMQEPQFSGRLRPFLSPNQQCMNGEASFDTVQCMQAKSRLHD